MTRISWHPAFEQAIKHELEDYLDVLTFEAEHQLTTEPLKIDVLIIKKEKDVVIEKNFAQIFRSCNVIEYKSPEDSVTVEAYHKTQCYARLYASLNKVDINEMSVTVVSTLHPKKLLTFLRKQYTVKHTQRGIYLVEGDTCPTQVLVSVELSKEDNLWLNSLRKDLSSEQLEQIAMSKGKKVPMDAYFQVIGAANIEAMRGLYMKRKKGVILSEEIDAAFTEKYAVPSKADTVMVVLRARFSKVPKKVESTIRQISDPIVLDSCAAQAATCHTIEEFGEALK